MHIYIHVYEENVIKFAYTYIPQHTPKIEKVFCALENLKSNKSVTPLA